MGFIIPAFDMSIVNPTFNELARFNGTDNYVSNFADITDPNALLIVERFERDAKCVRVSKTVIEELGGSMPYNNNYAVLYIKDVSYPMLRYRCITVTDIKLKTTSYVTYQGIRYAVSYRALSSTAPIEVMAGAYNTPVEYNTFADVLANETVLVYSDAYPITYRLTNCTAPTAPAEAAVGDTVTVTPTFPTGYGVVNPATDAYVMNNGVLVPSTYSNGTLTFTMPDPSPTS